jgi:photosystem II stability/assembly factor-like uncharacterized protein
MKPKSIAQIIVSFILVLSSNLPAGEGEWTSGGPEAYPVRSFAINPETPPILLAGTPGRGLFRSTDSGLSWTQLENGFSGVYFDDYFDAISFHPLDPTIIYVGEDGAGVFKSPDSGDSWTAMNQGLPNGFIAVYSIVIDPQHPETLWISVGGDHGIYKSTNGGNTWEEKNQGLKASLRIPAITIDRKNTSILYIATSYDGVFKTTDGGENWELSSNGIPSVHSSSLVIDQSNPQIIYLGTYTDGVYWSTDGGESWQTSNLGLTDTNVQSLAIDPLIPSRLYAGTRSGVFISSDSGISWELSKSGLGNLVVRTLAVDPLESNIVYAGTFMGVHQSTDTGMTWSPRLNGFPSPLVYWVGVHPTNDDILYIGTYNCGIFRSTDAGETWIPMNDGIRFPIIFALAADSDYPNIIYAGSGFGGVYKTQDGGTHWHTINVGLGSVDNTFPSIILHPRDSEIIYAGDRGVVNISTDGGETWNPTDNGLPLTFNNSLAVDLNDPTHIYTGTNMYGVYVTTNGGETWIEANTGLNNGWAQHVQELDVSPLGSEVQSNGLPEGVVRSLTIDPIDPMHLLVAVEDAGVYESFDNGENWTDLGSPGLTNFKFWSIAMDRSDPPRIHVGTSEGVFNLTRVPTDVDDPPSGPGLPRSFALSQNYPNPFNPSTTIAFDLPGAAGSKQLVSLTIYDIRGRLVRKLVNQEKEPGTYQVHWDGRDEHGQQASSGVYLYRIKAGDFTSVRKMVLVR